MKQKVLMVMAHPDDELLWGFPVLFDDRYEVYLFCVSDNHQSYHEAETASIKVALRTNIKMYSNMRIEANFYTTPARRNDVYMPLTGIEYTIREHIKIHLEKSGIDTIFTHNCVGEYGHGDHRLLWEICRTSSAKNIMYTDICLKNKSHISYEKMPEFYADAFYSRYFERKPKYSGRRHVGERERIGFFKRDNALFEKLKAIYVKHRAWSWNNPAPDTCNLFLDKT